MNAAIDGRADAVRRLLEGGAAVNAQDREGWTALHFAVQRCDTDVTVLLLGAGADPDLRDGNGNTALFRAVFAYRNAADCISPLLAAGANPDAVNDHGVSPRTLARSIANYDSARFFETD